MNPAAATPEAQFEQRLADARVLELREDLADLRQAVESGDVLRTWNAALAVSYSQGRSGRAADGLKAEVEQLLAAALALLRGGRR